MSGTYEGWNTYETFVVNNFLTNDSETVETVRAIVMVCGGDVRQVASEIEAFCDATFFANVPSDENTLAGAFMQSARNEICWKEIARNFCETHRELLV